MMVLIHRSPDQVVLSASALSLALDVSSSRVWKIKENIDNHRSALRDVFVPLAEPLSVAALTCTKGTSNVILATADTTMALSITFAFANTIAPISVYDYEVVGTDNQADADGDAAGNAAQIRRIFLDGYGVLDVRTVFFIFLRLSSRMRAFLLIFTKINDAIKVTLFDVIKIIKKYGMETSDPMDTPMVEKSKLDANPQGKEVDPTRYCGMIGSFMYLTASRPNLVFVVCMCVRYQAKPIEKHLHAVKRIFRYLRGTINMGLWYSKDSCFALTSFADVDHVGCQDTKRSTSRSMQLLGDRLHIDIIYHFITEQAENGVVELYFVRTEYQLADIFTKALGRERLDFLINKLGMKSMSPETRKRFAEEEEE
ncbi:hypothetical protein Tco_0040622 [Tanacetum coccineum]